MSTLYKLTTQDNRTRPGRDNECLWGESVTHSGTGKGNLCSPGYIHAYSDPRLAVIFNPAHADYQNPKLWVCEGDITINDAMKLGCVSLTTLHEIPLPKISLEQEACFAILCAKETEFDNAEWNAWADGYLSGQDRSRKSAYYVGKAVCDIYSDYTIHITPYAAYSAYSAISDAANTSNNDVAYAAYYATSCNDKIDFVSLIDKAMKLGERKD